MSKLHPVRSLLSLILLLAVSTATVASTEPAREGKAHGDQKIVSPLNEPPASDPALDLVAAKVTYHEELDLLIFKQTVRGRAGSLTPTPNGALDGAPVLGHVFPTDLKPGDVGFTAGDGIVALAVTSHPDFDDTPLWDENGDRNYGNDGVVFHTHWVVLVPDDRVAGGLAVQQIRQEDIARVLPPTHPGMPMLMDSPGFSTLLQGSTLKVLVPAQRVSGRKDFAYDAVTAYMEVATRDGAPMLGVHKVYSVLSGDLSLPYRVE